MGSGHGTFVHDEDVVASVAGTIERVNKLITVRPVRTRSAEPLRKYTLFPNSNRKVQPGGRGSCCWKNNRG